MISRDYLIYLITGLILAAVVFGAINTATEEADKSVSETKKGVVEKAKCIFNNEENADEECAGTSGEGGGNSDSR